MPATIPLQVFAAVLLVITGALINTLGAKVAEKTRCFRACGLDKKMSLTKPPQLLDSVLCNRCLRRRSVKHTFVEKTIFQRRKRSTFSNNCPGRANESTPVPEEQYASRPLVAIQQYEDTDNWFADVSWDPLNDPYKYLKGHLIRLSVGPGPDIFCTVLPKNQTSLRINISQYGYHYPDYIELGIISIPHKKNIAMNIYDVIPLPSSESPPTISTKTEKATTKTTTTTRVTITSDKITKDYTTTLITTLAVSLGVLGGLTFAACLLKSIFSRRPKSSKLPPEFKYHAFIIFSREDESWVTGELLPFLEEESHLKCCVHYRDFMPGKPFEVNMEESVYNSYKVIAVFSKNLMLSNYCIHELDLAKYRLLKERDDSLVVMRIDKTDCEKLPRGLKKRSFIDYANPLEKPFWKSKLIKFLDTSNDLDEGRMT